MVAFVSDPCSVPKVRASSICSRLIEFLINIILSFLIVFVDPVCFQPTCFSFTYICTLYNMTLMWQNSSVSAAFVL